MNEAPKTTFSLSQAQISQNKAITHF